MKQRARVAVIGAGPGGLVAAKHAIEAGFKVTVFESSDDLGGQWHSTAAHSGVWPGMRTNTSRMMTAFSDFPAPVHHELYPLAEQIQDYLRDYARSTGVLERIRFNTSVTALDRGWRVNGEPFDGVVVASGRFRKPRIPEHLRSFTGELLHAFDYPGRDRFVGKRVLVYGNGISGHEIASDVAVVTRAISAYRKPRYVLQKVVDGIPSDWRWYTQAGALERRLSPPEEWSRRLRDQVVRVCGHPSDFGAPKPADDILVAGHSLCQDYLMQVREGSIVCRPEIVSAAGNRVTFSDGSSVLVDTIICATGYDIDVPYLPQMVRSTLGPDLRAHVRTVHPDLPHFAMIGQFALQGPYFPLLELQARWITGLWTGSIRPPSEQSMRASIAMAPPSIDSHHTLALDLAEQAGVTPRLTDHPDLAEALMFGPMLPPRYRLDGPGSLSHAKDMFLSQLATSPYPPIDPEGITRLSALGYDLPANPSPARSVNASTALERSRP